MDCLQASDLQDKEFSTLSLGFSCIKFLKKHLFQTIAIDTHLNKKLSGGMLLAISFALSRRFRKQIKEHRIGIVLPPGIGAIIVNLACILAGKTPVNLNFTIGRSANESCIGQAEIKTVITAKQLTEKLPDFAWPEQCMDVKTLLKKIWKIQILVTYLFVLTFSAKKLAFLFGVSEKGGRDEVGLLFTSGSTGEPKGVVLSHQNILANVAQIKAILPKQKIPTILGCLPFFHSFGFTVTLWWPLLGGPQVITSPNPLEISKLAEVIQKYSIALIVTTPTFLRGFLKRAQPEQLRSLQTVITGAEKLPASLLQSFQEKFKIPVCEGYGFTEASPVVSTNLPASPEWGSQHHYRIGSVGKLVPGMSVRVTHPESGDPLQPMESGQLWFHGPNIFEGYLNKPDITAQVLQDGWYMSGDLGHVDEEGFLYIQGRQSRFSKIGGEMVPHGTIEQAINDICTAMGEEDCINAVVGVQDSSKGESLAVLTTAKIEPSLLRNKLAERGLPNLWIPKTFHRLDKVPVLANGKLDLQSCQKLANELAQN
jgi:acyl-[acyl-carrier-protein]-phospholipid O-acyltransferase/long-chain-fatty-acid--[acyl-carrier-protein] ligase